ncbi:hypothetical protein [Zobellia alginiliquefaciens]|uniref:hypothetical protein n=1 Tax=Zobellia alginiliquefaciens TaxID=3032586 RepID=UPI0023E428F0|nr:hypothetical protein [Zobellia alginiliquefaciens]
MIRKIARENTLNLRAKHLNRQIRELKRTFENNFPQYPSDKFEMVRDFNIKLVRAKSRLKRISKIIVKNRRQARQMLIRVTKEIQILKDTNRQLSKSSESSTNLL